MKMQSVLITGYPGQDATNMINFLLNNTTCVIYASTRRRKLPISTTMRITYIHMNILKTKSVNKCISQILPNFCINFAGYSSLGKSFANPLENYDTNIMGVARLLDSIRIFCPNCRFFSAGSKEEFGEISGVKSLDTFCFPSNPYAVGKFSARWIVNDYRKNYNIFAIHCILFNHESTNRGEEFVTKKIVLNIKRIADELSTTGTIKTPLFLGNIFATRDWSSSNDFMEAIWLMLNVDGNSENHLLSSGEIHSVKEFVELCCKYIGIKNIKWLETGNLVSGENIIVISTPCMTDSKIIYGDSEYTRKKIGWIPKTSFEDLVFQMMRD